jgi:hypothetical protein
MFGYENKLYNARTTKLFCLGYGIKCCNQKNRNVINVQGLDDLLNGSLLDATFSII